ncbi:MAG: M28 family peptidase [Gemmatimonadaceae bacterium]
MTRLPLRLALTPLTLLVLLAAPRPLAAQTTASTPLGPTQGLVRDATLTAVLHDISPARLRATDSALVSFGTRNTLSDTLSFTRGIGAARRWLHAQMEAISKDCGGCLRVEYDPAMVEVMRDPARPTVNVVNVLGWLPGRDTTHLVVIGGHYDSCVCSLPGGGYDTTTTAPGADDDGSGSSAVLELARTFARHYPHGLNATIVFAIYAGEEQGLLGSTHLAKRLKDGGYTVLAGMTDDIAGDVRAEDGTVDSTHVRIFAADPDNSPSRELGRYVWALGHLYLRGFTVNPIWRIDRIQRGGDHMPYVESGWAGLRFSEPLENYNHQHLPTDQFQFVNFGYLANVARANAMTVASIAAAPITPQDARAVREAHGASGGQAWALSWQPSPGAVKYEVLIRRTISPQYERVVDVGNVTNYVLHTQLDDEWAGVRAVDAHGHRSMTAPLPSPPPLRSFNRAPEPGRGARGGSGPTP